MEDAVDRFQREMPRVTMPAGFANLVFERMRGDAGDDTSSVTASVRFTTGTGMDRTTHEVRTEPIGVPNVQDWTQFMISTVVPAVQRAVNNARAKAYIIV